MNKFIVFCSSFIVLLSSVESINDAQRECQQYFHSRMQAPVDHSQIPAGPYHTAYFPLMSETSAHRAMVFTNSQNVLSEFCGVSHVNKDTMEMAFSAFGHTVLAQLEMVDEHSSVSHYVDKSSPMAQFHDGKLKTVLKIYGNAALCGMCFVDGSRDWALASTVPEISQDMVNEVEHDLHNFGFEGPVLRTDYSTCHL